MYTFSISKLATKELAEVVPDLQYSGPVKLTKGLHKLASQLMFLLYTEYGSISGLPDIGLSVKQRLGSVSMSETSVVSQIVSDIAGEARRQLANLTRGLPDDERVGEVDIQAVDILDFDELKVSISISSASGSAAVYDMTLIAGALS